MLDRDRLDAGLDEGRGTSSFSCTIAGDCIVGESGCSFRRVAPRRRPAVAGLAVLLVACSAPRMPPPEDAAVEYATAVQRGDSQALHAMLTERARRAVSPADIDRYLRENKQELEGLARALRAERPQVLGKAELFVKGGTVSELELSRGTFWVRSRDLAPTRPTSPEQAAVALREAVLHRDYERVLALLTTSGKSKMESAFQALDAALAELETSVVSIRQDRAVIELLGGRRILLKRENAAWLVEEVE